MGELYGGSDMSYGVSYMGNLRKVARDEILQHGCRGIFIAEIL